MSADFCWLAGAVTSVRRGSQGFQFSESPGRIAKAEVGADLCMPRALHAAGTLAGQISLVCVCKPWCLMCASQWCPKTTHRGDFSRIAESEVGARYGWCLWVLCTEGTLEGQLKLKWI